MNLGTGLPLATMVVATTGVIHTVLANAPASALATIAAITGAMSATSPATTTGVLVMIVTTTATANARPVETVTRLAAVTRLALTAIRPLASAMRDLLFRPSS